MDTFILLIHTKSWVVVWMPAQIQESEGDSAQEELLDSNQTNQMEGNRMQHQCRYNS